MELAQRLPQRPVPQPAPTWYLSMCSRSSGCVTFIQPVSFSMVKMPSGGVSAPCPVML